MEYFKDEEFYCQCGTPECDGKRPVVPGLRSKLNVLRASLGKPIIIDSGVRCKYWNAKQGGVGDSEHMTGEAVDVKCDNSTMRYLLLKLGLGIFDRVGVGKNFIHFGVSQTHDKEVVWGYYP